MKNSRDTSKQARPSKAKQGQARVRVSKCKRRAQTSNSTSKIRDCSKCSRHGFDRKRKKRSKRGENAGELRCIISSTCTRAVSRVPETCERLAGLQKVCDLSQCKFRNVQCERVGVRAKQVGVAYSGYSMCVLAMRSSDWLVLECRRCIQTCEGLAAHSSTAGACLLA